MQTVEKQSYALSLMLAVLTPLILSGCEKTKTPEIVPGETNPQIHSTQAGKSYSVADLSPILGSSSYTMVTQEVGGQGVKRRYVKSVTTLLDEPGPSGCPGLQWVADSVRTRDDGSTEHMVLKGCRGERGDGYYAVSMNGRPEERFATMILQPSAMRIGDSWAAIHEDSRPPSYRSCEVKAPTVCEEGVDLECVTKFDNRTVWIRDYYCLVEGWMGQINVLALDDRGEVTRSVDIVINGKSKRDVSQLETPFPTLEEVRTLSQKVKDQLINTP